MRSAVSIGVPGAIGPEAVRVLAPRIEAAGFAGLWLNDGSAGDPLVALAAAAETTTHLRLATGVVPIDRRPAPALLRDLPSSGVPDARLTLGIGSGQLRTGAVGRVAEALIGLRDGTAAALVVGALGPRMRRLGAEHADGVLLSWLPPDVAAQQAAELRDLGGRAQGLRRRSRRGRRLVRRGSRRAGPARDHPDRLAGRPARFRRPRRGPPGVAAAPPVGRDLRRHPPAFPPTVFTLFTVR